MKTFPTDNELRQAHDAFNSEHDRLRGELLEALPNHAMRSDRTTRTGYRSIGVPAAMAACVVLLFVVWFIGGDINHRPAFALDDVKDRMLKVRSLYYKGVTYQTFDVGGKEIEQSYAIEGYAERPLRYFHKVSGTEHDGQEVRIKTGMVGVDAGQAFVVSDNEKVVTVWDAKPLSTELSVENALQNQWVNQFMHGAIDNYQLVGIESIRGQKAAKYELVEKSENQQSRTLIWLSEETGLPVRSVVYNTDKSGRERLASNYETIEFNADPPANRMPFSVPDGFRVNKIESPSEDFVIASGSARNERAILRYPFAIDDRAILVCWCRETNDQDPLQDHDPIPPEVIVKLTAAASRKCDLIPLQTHVDDGHLWRWGLAVPSDRAPLRSGEYLDLIFRSEKQRGYVSLANFALRLSDERLIAMIAHMEGLGKPIDQTSPRVSLSRLRRLAERHATGENVDDRPADEK